MRKQSLKPILTEQQEQELLVECLELKKIKFSALPLDTYTEHWAIRNKNKRIGVRPGVPDLMLIIPANPKKVLPDNLPKLVFIEMKRSKGGVLRDNQREWLKALNQCFGVKAFVAEGFEKARKIIENML
jgi:hypothetical protein